MPMDVVQIRLTENQIKEIDRLVRKGVYPNRSEAVRDAVRKLVAWSVPSGKGGKRWKK